MKSSNNARWVVLKFGGTSVSSLKSWEAIASVVRQRLENGLRPFIVISAFSRVSDLLELLLKSSIDNSYQKALKDIEVRHKDIADELGVNLAVIKEELDLLVILAKDISKAGRVDPKVHAQVLSCGELMSTKIGCEYLKKNGISISWHDAKEYLLARELDDLRKARAYISSSCDFDKDDNIISKINGETESAIITQGFIARNKAGETVLLGRGGSDVSAAYFAAKMGAEGCEIWTDVPGVYTANPHHVPSARLIKTLDYEEAQEVSSSGAKILHPRCIEPVKKHNIPLFIHSLSYLSADGTKVTGDCDRNVAHIKAISSRIGITLISMETVEMWHQVGFLAEIFTCFKRHGVSIDIVSTSETNVTVTLDHATNTMKSDDMNNLVSDLRKFCKVEIVESCALISLIGRNIRTILHELTPAMKVFEEYKIYLISQAADDLNLTFVVDEEHSGRLVEMLHKELFGEGNKAPYFGQTWKDLIEDKKDSETVLPSKWWHKKRDRLLEIAAKNTPLYVYDGESIDQRISNLKGIKSVDKIFYSVKANWNQEVLKMFFNAGFDFECVSIDEIRHILKTFPMIDPKRILFTPNFAPKSEYEFGFEKNVHVTLDNIYPLSAWPEVFKNREVFVRIDPGKGLGHHKFVRTAGSKSKFGVSPNQIDELHALVKKNNVKVVGLHAHVGSNIFKADAWSNTAGFLNDVAAEFKDIRFLDLGGGLGVIEKPGQHELDLAKIDTNLQAVKDSKYQIWIEPGRYLVANAGVLLAKVTQTKTKSEYNYIGIDAGMNSLIRPSLYGSYHEIVNLSRMDQKATVQASVVGPICETGDVLGHSRLLPESKDGDVVLIDTVGAYGRVMASSYNMRPPAEEVFL